MDRCDGVCLQGAVVLIQSLEQPQKRARGFLWENWGKNISECTWMVFVILC